MKLQKTLFLLLMCLTTYSLHAAGDIKLQELCQGRFAARGIANITPMQDGESYCSLSPDHKQILQYSYRNGEQTAMLFDANNTKGVIKLDHIDGFILSPDQKRILLRTQTKGIYRHSHTAVYYIYHINNRTVEPLSEGGPQEVPMWSRDGNMIAFVREGNLFLVKLLFNNSESQITKDGEFGKVINGKPDWVNEEEFSFAQAFDFNEDNTMLAWIRYDESDVPLFSFPLYKGLQPELTQYADYPGSYAYRYPVAGQKNSTVSVQTFDIKSRVIRTMQLTLEPDGYIPRIHFTDDPLKLLILTQNRLQNRLDIYVGNPRSTECRCIVRDETEKYIDDNVYTNFALTPGGFVLMSERSGWNHLYLYDLNGTLKRQLTKGDWAVTAFYGYDAATSTVYYASTQEGPTKRTVYKSDLKGKVTPLTTQSGTNNARFSRDLKYFINTYSNVDTPPVITLCSSAKGQTVKVLQDNQDLKQAVVQLNLGKREFFSFTTSDGVELNGLRILPPNFDTSKRYPVIMFQYSGPGSQQVVDSWNAGNMGGTLYEQYLAQQGFISIIVDGRGTGGRGREFQQCTYLRLGQLESHDQAEAAAYLATLPYVDGAHIGIWGWSFGGFNTLMSMSEGRGLFAAGVAVAAPTNWKFYDTVYTERFMRTPAQNAEGYADCPIGRAQNLKGALLLCHGLADDNVHFRNIAEYTEALVQADKDFYQINYTNRNHGISGGNTRYHLFRQITQWFNTYLK